MSVQLHPGTLIADRFVLEYLAGQGGMGVVYRARDSLTGQPVALKLLPPASNTESSRRFVQEAGLLASLRHPALVSYVAHGLTQHQQLFLAMEWLEGEDLAQRLARGPLELNEVLRLARRVAEGLAHAHQQGIIHRDLKPSNLMLRHGQAEAAVLVDFGLARHVIASQQLTATSAVLGTPGYMAPEQASSEPQLTPRVDLFSLGCVLYECLTGQPPFAAPHPAAVMAKILFSEPAPLRTLRPELPPSLYELMDRLLAKSPAQRLADAQALLAALEVLEGRPGRWLGLATSPASEPHAEPPRLAGAEQQLVSVLLATGGTPQIGEPPAAPPSQETSLASPQQLLLEALRHYPGARVEQLADGSLAATLAGHGTATDQAALVARCALALKERWPQASVVLATGLGVLGEQRTMGEAMERASRLLQQCEQLPASAASQVLMDEVTAGLLGPGFQLSRPRSGTFLLRGESLRADETRPLLGKPTPCVGREQELALLELAFSACVEEPSAQAVLVVAPPGVGKSRLRHEFLRRLQRRAEPPRVLLARGAPPLSSGSAYGLLGQALRGLCEVRDGEPPQLSWEKLAQRLTRHLLPQEVPSTLELLGELCGLAPHGEDSARERKEHTDPRVVSAKMSQALQRLFAAECNQGPVLLVLEDLHWGDMLTVRLVEQLLRQLARSPLMVLALARPELKGLFPGLWSQWLQELPLRGLSRQAGMRLAREVLGPLAPEATLARLVEQAAGNALFLEELIRGVAEGRGEAPPETVLAMLQARLARLEPQARQVLLAGSVFGRTFWPGGVRALLSEELTPAGLERLLAQLIHQEIIEPQSGRRFGAEPEYHFRHALVREAAYGLVPEGPRAAGHRAAGAWLERVGEEDSLVLAEHYRLGQQQEQAASLYARAAEQLLGRAEAQGALRCLEEGLACGPSAGLGSRLRALKMSAFFWIEDSAKVYEIGIQLLPELPAGSLPWCRLAVGMVLVSGYYGLEERSLAELSQLLLRTTPEPEAVTAWVEAVRFAQIAATLSGNLAVEAACRARVEELLGTRREAIAEGWMCFANFYHALVIAGRPWQALEWAKQGTRAHLEAGVEYNTMATLTAEGICLAALGDIVGARQVLRECVELARRAGQSFPLDHALVYLSLVLSVSPEPAHWEEAREEASTWLAGQHGNIILVGLAHTALARAALRRGALLEAQGHGRKAVDNLRTLPAHQCLAFTALSAALRAQGQVAEARAVASEGVQLLQRLECRGVQALELYLALAEACLAQGDNQATQAALHQALELLRASAEDIPQGPARQRFLHAVPANARILALAGP